VLLLLMRVRLVALMWRPAVWRSLVGLQTHAPHLCLHIPLNTYEYSQKAAILALVKAGKP
jgi:hypothetical protein